MPPTTIGANRTNVDEPSVLTGANETVHTNDFPAALARRQLLAELKEATTMVSESVTPEARNFWRNHAAELQTRLRALHGEEPQLDDLETEYGLKPNGDPLSRDAASGDVEDATAYQSMNDAETQERLVEVRVWCMPVVFHFVPAARCTLINHLPSFPFVSCSFSLKFFYLPYVTGDGAIRPTRWLYVRG
jgi:hypothetical protein